MPQVEARIESTQIEKLMQFNIKCYMAQNSLLLHKVYHKFLKKKMTFAISSKNADKRLHVDVCGKTRIFYVLHYDKTWLFDK